MFDKTKKKVRLLPDEQKEATTEKEKIKQAKANRAKAEGVGSMADLEKMILAKRDNAFGGFLNYMADKYGGEEEPKVSKKRKQAEKQTSKQASPDKNKRRKLN